MTTAVGDAIVLSPLTRLPAPNIIGCSRTRMGLIPDTTYLLHRAIDGDLEARERFWELLYPRLWRIAHGRLPGRLLRFEGTEDVVQKALVKAFRRIDRFRNQPARNFLLYLRAAILNVVKTELRRHWEDRTVPIDGQEPDLSPSPVEHAIGKEKAAKYEEALALLESRNKSYYVAHVMYTELGLSCAEIGESLGKTTEAARMDVVRARKFLAEVLADE